MEHCTEPTIHLNEPIHIHRRHNTQRKHQQQNKRTNIHRIRPMPRHGRKPWNPTTYSIAAAAATPTCNTQSNAFRACYYDNKDFTNLKINRINNTINYNWAKAAPASNMSADTFSASWIGSFALTPGRKYTLALPETTASDST